MGVALLGAVLAGALTVLAPCALSLLPVIVAGTADGAVQARSGLPRALVVIAGLAASVVAFTLLLKASTSLIGIPTSVWRWISGGLLVALGLAGLFPELWDRISMTMGLGNRSGGALAAANKRSGLVGAALTGAALGPVFTSCSPLYAYVVVTVLPAAPAEGLALLAAYVFGLSAVLFAIALGGQRVVRRLGWGADPHSWFRRGLGLVLVIIGLLVLTGLMQQVEVWVLEHSPVQPWLIGSDIGRQP